jgi:hypothetical protein
LRVVKVDKAAIISKGFLKEKISYLHMLIKELISSFIWSDLIHGFIIYNGYKLAFANLNLAGLSTRVYNN